MNQDDIKRVIDQLDLLDFGSIEDKHIKNNAVELLETLGNKVAEQAAVIEKLKDELFETLIQDMNGESGRIVLQKFNSDSKQILADWMREQLGEPHLTLSLGTELFKKPECLK